MSAVVEEKRIVKGGAFLIEERTPAEIFTPEDFTEEHRHTSTNWKNTIGNLPGS